LDVLPILEQEDSSDSDWYDDDTETPDTETPDTETPDTDETDDFNDDPRIEPYEDDDDDGADVADDEQEVDLIDLTGPAPVQPSHRQLLDEFLAADWDDEGTKLDPSYFPKQKVERRKTWSSPRKKPE